MLEILSSIADGKIPFDMDRMRSILVMQIRRFLNKVCCQHLLVIFHSRMIIIIIIIVSACVGGSDGRGFSLFCSLSGYR